MESRGSTFDEINFASIRQVYERTGTKPERGNWGFGPDPEDLTNCLQERTCCGLGVHVIERLGGIEAACLACVELNNDNKFVSPHIRLAAKTLGMTNDQVIEFLYGFDGLESEDPESEIRRFGRECWESVEGIAVHEPEDEPQGEDDSRDYF